MLCSDDYARRVRFGWPSGSKGFVTAVCVCGFRYMFLSSDVEVTHQHCFCAERVKSRPSDPLISETWKGRVCLLPPQRPLFIEFLHPVIVLCMECFLEKELTPAQVYPVLWLCLLEWLLGLCSYTADFTESVTEDWACGIDLVDHTLKHVLCLTDSSYSSWSGH